MPEIEDEKLKAAMKVAFREAARSFLDEKFATFGKWSAGGLAAAGLVALTYFILWSNGWHK